MDAKEILGKMVDKMTPENWGQGEYYYQDWDPNTDEYFGQQKACLYGHIGWASNQDVEQDVDTPEVLMVATKIVACIRDSGYCLPSNDLVLFNDDEATTFDDVFQVVKQAYLNELEGE